MRNLVLALLIVAGFIAYSERNTGKDYDDYLTKELTKIYYTYSDKPVTLIVRWDDSLHDKHQNGHTKRIGENKYLIRLATTNKMIWYHEVAHVITYDEPQTHGPEWAKLMYKMGMSQDVHRYGY